MSAFVVHIGHMEHIYLPVLMNPVDK